MNRVDVKVLMMKKGVSIAKLSRKLEVTPQFIYDILASNRRSKRIESELEKAFDLPISEIRKAWENTNLEDSDSRARAHAIVGSLRPAKAAVNQ